ncbi:GTP-binding protein [Entamoeba histolytica]|uniref:GTP-binding protein n=5 Tax=Entamoeba TaxID=5758 RepID=A0A175JSQ1_ENTHI|nr:GTP-binding protein, putative [Entamoeba histolytica KU27]ENY60402.1 GTP-binding protein, putative [Entamoeba histolytica HM-1:IMSS-A]GAT96492.1 GTP-binding protein [Entamoeba histolytica]
MARSKPRNKRQTLSKKHSIEKKIGRHNQKMRRLAKKFPEARKKLKKEPGVPHLYPFKEELIHKYENALKKKQEDKIAARDARKNQVKTAESTPNETK